MCVGTVRETCVYNIFHLIRMLAAKNDGSQKMMAATNDGQKKEVKQDKLLIKQNNNTSEEWLERALVNRRRSLNVKPIKSCAGGDHDGIRKLIDCNYQQ